MERGRRRRASARGGGRGQAAGGPAPPAAHTVRRGAAPVDLTVREFALLEYLMRHRGEAVSRARLIDAAWDRAYRGESNVVDVYVGRLRDKIDRPFARRTIQTVRGIGY